MSQNLLSLTLTDAQLKTIDDALVAIEGALTGLIALDGDERRGLLRMGAKSEQFCRQTLSVLSQNPQLIPPSMKLAEGQADLVAIDRLRPRLQRLQRLTERAEDSETALGSDVMALALEATRCSRCPRQPMPRNPARRPVESLQGPSGAYTQSKALARRGFFSFGDYAPEKPIYTSPTPRP